MGIRLREGKTPRPRLERLPLTGGERYRVKVGRSIHETPPVDFHRHPDLGSTVGTRNVV
ncbi:hypothetical protein HSR121_2779 [Halapricum desulfuricans]|uniref:Uncharacterized protein n=1 Tax=Halapricum desulfuricans TaxID=2841257 RepID=A0A897N7U3_9EURY|nr:hypothetical protein HSR121_2779 [Halapricum desulfuricans]